MDSTYLPHPSPPYVRCSYLDTSTSHIKGKKTPWRSRASEPDTVGMLGSPDPELKMMIIMCVCSQSCPTLCDHRNCGPPDSSVHGISLTRILEWAAISFSEWINILGALMEKADSTQEHMGNKSRDGNPKKEPRNARDKKHCNRNEECLWEAY